MKKTIFILGVTMFMSGTIFIGCQTSAEKEEAAQDKVEDAQKDLNAVQAANAEEWTTFKSDAQLKIQTNENRIAELKVEIKKPGKVYDAAYESKIDTLELENNALNARLETYEQSPSDWQSFKNKFNHDMDEVGQSLKGLSK